MPKEQSVDTYLASLAPQIRGPIETLRQTIRGVLPDAEEVISYGIPAFKSAGRVVVHYAGWKSHLSLYPIPEVDAETETQIAPYRAGKGTLRFALDEPLPVALVVSVVTLLRDQRHRLEDGQDVQGA